MPRSGLFRVGCLPGPGIGSTAGSSPTITGVRNTLSEYVTVSFGRMPRFPCDTAATDSTRFDVDPRTIRSTLSVNDCVTDDSPACTASFTFIETRPKNPTGMVVVVSIEPSQVPPAVCQLTAVFRRFHVAVVDSQSCPVAPGSVTGLTLTVDEGSPATIAFPDTVNSSVADSTVLSASFSVANLNRMFRVVAPPPCSSSVAAVP
jgi:hypothetical protein